MMQHFGGVPRISRGMHPFIADIAPFLALKCIRLLFSLSPLILFVPLSDLPPNMEVMLQKMGPPCAAPFLEQHRGDLGAHNTLLVTFNGGFGNSIGGGGGDPRLFWDWHGDLCAISDSGIPALFTCANDYADAEGEVRMIPISKP